MAAALGMMTFQAALAWTTPGLAVRHPSIHCTTWRTSGPIRHPRHSQLQCCTGARPADLSTYCLVPPQDEALSKYSTLRLLLPLALPIAALVGYDEVIGSVTWLVDTFSPGEWIAVDGGKTQVEAIVPTMNGIVVPTLSFALSTLAATTIGSLRQRQVALRTCLNKEAANVDMLVSVLECIFDGPHRTEERREALLLLREYTSRLIGESRHGLDEGDLERLEREGAANSELRALLRLLHRSPGHRSGIFHEAGLVTDYTPPELLQAQGVSTAPQLHEALPTPMEYDEPRFFITTEFQSQTIVRELLGLRAERLALLLTTFPPTNWLTIALARVSIHIAFLVESDDQALLFLDRLQLRLMFALLVGALSGIGIILYELNDPFRGPYRITPSTSHLVSVRTALDESLCAEAEDALAIGAEA